MTRQVASWFSGREAGDTRLGRDYQQRDQSSTEVTRDHIGVLFGQTGIVKIQFILKEISVKVIKRVRTVLRKGFCLRTIWKQVLRIFSRDI